MYVLLVARLDRVERCSDDDCVSETCVLLLSQYSFFYQVSFVHSVLV